MSVRLWSLLVWALVGASAVFWALKVVARPQALPQQTNWAGTPNLVQGDLGRLVGTDAQGAPAPGADLAGAPAGDGRLVLVGVVSAAGLAGNEAAAALAAAQAAPLPHDSPAAAAAPREGLALISVDGKPARAYAVGDVVDGERVLQRVSPRAAQVGLPGQPAQLLLALPQPPEPAQGAVAPLPTAAQPAPGSTPAKP